MDLPGVRCRPAVGFHGIAWLLLDLNEAVDWLAMAICVRRYGDVLRREDGH